MATHSNGISALQLQNQLGLGSYRTAWMLCAKLRRAVVNPEREPLRGRRDDPPVPHQERPDCRACGPQRGRQDAGGWRGRSRRRQPPACPYARDRGLWQARTPCFRARRRRSPYPAGHRQLALVPGHPAVRHNAITLGAMAAHIALPWIHRLFSNLKRWGLGVYDELRKTNLEHYLDEFVFRFNRRRIRHAAFNTLLSIGARTTPTPYHVLIRKVA